MLVLTRKLNEQIQIGNDVTIKILRIKGKAVRIGIEAPENIRVIRSELRSCPNESAESADQSPVFSSDKYEPSSADSDVSSAATAGFQHERIHESLHDLTRSVVAETEVGDVKQLANFRQMLARRRRRRRRVFLPC